jgi:hypothetical protein
MVKEKLSIGFIGGGRITNTLNRACEIHGEMIKTGK